MAADEGASRNRYYEKLGFCGNDEKNIQDLLVFSSPLDLGKLSELCERSDLDRRHIEAWKVLLGVECGRRNPFDDQANFKRVRAEHYELLKHHLEVILRHNLVIKDRMKQCSIETKNPALDDIKPNFPNCNHQNGNNAENAIGRPDDKSGTIINAINQTTKVTNGEPGSYSAAAANNPGRAPSEYKPSPECNLLQLIEVEPGKLVTLMYLLETGKLEPLNIEAALKSIYCRQLSSIATKFVNVSSDMQEAFFLFRNFAKKLEDNGSLKPPQTAVINKS